jgi:poly-beta-1,6-N-acetyl-D-glucosamine biosynthesis protein PgaD
MKSQHDLVIDLRQHLPWHKRYVSNTTTALMWGAWLMLLRPFLLVWILIQLQKSAAVHHLLNALSLSLEYGGLELLLCSVGLLLWNRFMPLATAKKPDLEPPLASQHYADYFALATQQIELSRNSKITVVHHNQQGQIVDLEAFSQD